MAHFYAKEIGSPVYKSCGLKFTSEILFKKIKNTDVYNMAYD